VNSSDATISTMTLDGLLQDIYTLEDEIRDYKRKYHVLSETFYESYTAGEKPPDDSWVRDWTGWASACEFAPKAKAHYRAAIDALRANGQIIAEMIQKAARYESVSVPWLITNDSFTRSNRNSMTSQAPP
jgi:hypothetical protein